MNIFIRPNGNAQCLYGENINLAKLGQLDIKRASHVEPNENKPGEWIADLAPVGGPLFEGFDSRAAALAAEEKWLNAKMAQFNIHVVT
jgi:hypothetical protein